MKVVFEDILGKEIPTSYKGISRISIGELVATKELLEYEHEQKIEGYVILENKEEGK